MRSPDDGAPEFAKLWVTQFLVQPLPEAEQHQGRLTQLATTSAGDNVFELSDDSIAWLRAQVCHGVTQLTQTEPESDGVRWCLQGRFQCVRLGEYAPLRDRRRVSLSGLYFISSPAQPTDTGRDDLSLGCVSFFDPRPAMNMNAIKGDPYEIAEQVLRPAPGLLLIWPGYLRYFVHPNLSPTPAYQVAFDVISVGVDP